MMFNFEEFHCGSAPPIRSFEPADGSIGFLAVGVQCADLVGSDVGELALKLTWCPVRLVLPPNCRSGVPDLAQRYPDTGL